MAEQVAGTCRNALPNESCGGLIDDCRHEFVCGHAARQVPIKMSSMTFDQLGGPMVHGAHGLGGALAGPAHQQVRRGGHGSRRSVVLCDHEW